jgi:hypothetical protein
VNKLPAPLTDCQFPDWWPAPSPLRAQGPTPRITVITPSFNQARFLEATLRSVLLQGYPDLEFIVIDGGSNDGSVDVLRHYDACLTHWVSESDAGQADAIRKGLEYATGEWVNWINSDDLLAPGALHAVAATGVQADLVAGCVHNFSARGRLNRVRPRNLELAPMITEHLGHAKWHQPGIWLRRDRLLRSGFPHRRHYSFDYEMLLRYLRLQPRVAYTDRTLAYFRMHDHSKTVAERRKGSSAFLDERIELLEDLARAPEFAAHAAALQRAGAQCAWKRTLEHLTALDQPRTRWQRLAWLWTAVREDPSLRCTRHARRAALRLLRVGWWPRRFTRQGHTLT